MKVLSRKSTPKLFPIFRYLALAASKDPTREVINYIKVDGDIAIATDGRILSTVKGPEISALKDGLYRIVKFIKSEVQIQLHDVNLNFPNWKQVVPSNYSTLGKIKEKEVKMNCAPSLISIASLSIFNPDNISRIIPPTPDFSFGHEYNPLNFTENDILIRPPLVIEACHEKHDYKSVCMPMKSETDLLDKHIRAEAYYLDALNNPKQQPTPPTENPKAVEKREPEKVEEETEKIHPTLSRNEEKNGIELRFPERPTSEILAAMKNHGFYWCKRKDGKPWVAKYTEERYIFADNLSKGIALFPKKTTKPSRAANALSALQ